MKSILIENRINCRLSNVKYPPRQRVKYSKVKLAGICGSDSHIYRGHNPLRNIRASLVMNSLASLMRWVKVWKAPESVNALLSIRWSAVGIAIRAL